MKRALQYILFCFCAVLILLFLLEGFISWARVTRKIFKATESAVVQSDKDIGWRLKPNLKLPNLYALGKNLTTDAHGVRVSAPSITSEITNDQPFICSGDSFTFGLGVSDQETWCHLLEKKGFGSAANLGVSGYSVLQSYLHYQSIGKYYPHKVHIFAFIHDDFKRNYGARPIARVGNGGFKIENIPVAPWQILLEDAKFYMSTLETMYALRVLTAKTLSAQTSDLSSENKEAAFHLFQELSHSDKSSNVTTVFVYLPIRYDFYNPDMQSWRKELADFFSKQNIIFIDLIELLKTQAVSSEKVQNMFFAKRNYDPYSIENHYTPEGHAFVAELLISQLKQRIPQTAAGH